MLINLAAREPAYNLKAQRLEQLPRYLFYLSGQPYDHREQFGIQLGESVHIFSPLFHRRGILLSFRLRGTFTDHEDDQSVEQFTSRNSRFFVSRALREVYDPREAGI